jgi:membrane dipeptidase
MVGLPELRRGRVAVIFGTIFLARREDWDGPSAERVTYRNEIEAEACGRAQLDVYRRLHEESAGFRMIRTREDLASVLDGWKDGKTGDVGIVVLMEGADPIRSPNDVATWNEDGVRIVGLAWKRTRYAGGTGAPGPLTEEGRALVDALGEEGVVLRSLARRGGIVLRSDRSLLRNRDRIARESARALSRGPSALG